MTDRPGLGTRILQRVVAVEPDEAGALLWSCAYFFCILSAYYVIRPLRDEMGVAGGVRNVPWLFSGTLLLMLVANPPFAALVSKLPRLRFVSITYRFFIATILLFYLLLNVLPQSSGVWVGRAFFIWVSVFNLFIISIFWAFMADIYSVEQGKRLFGFIAVGGSIGAIVGSAIAAYMAQRIGPTSLLLVSALLLELGVFAVRRLSTVLGDWVSPHQRAMAERPIGGNILAGVTHVARSPFLLGIVAYMLLYPIISTFLYFEQLDIVERTFADSGVRTAFFAKVDLAVNLLTMGAQVFLTGRLIKLLGVAVTLALLPLFSIVGFAMLGLYPTLAVIVTFQVLRRAGNFAVARPTRETLYTVVSREDRFKAKALIDTFVYRSGDQIGAWSWKLMTALGFTMAGVAFAAVPLCVTWAMVAVWLGQKQGKMVERSSMGDLSTVP